MSVALRELGVSEHDLGELKQAIEHDATPPTARGLGRKTGEWIGATAAKLGVGAVKLLALEATGVFSWVQRIDRVAERVKDLFGHWTNTYRIVRRSNVYQSFEAPKKYLPWRAVHI